MSGRAAHDVRSRVRWARRAALRARAGRRARAARATRRRRCDTWSTSSSSPNWASAAAESPPPTTVNAFVSAIAWATVRVPAANRSSSNMPIGPFQKTVRASMITSLNAAAVPGPMSKPFAPSGRRVPNVAKLPSASTPTMSSGRWIVLPAGRAARRHVSTWSRLEQRVADRVALRGEEREAHRAADDERVDDLQQRLDDAELVGDLRAAEHGDERALRVVAQAEEDVDLLLQQQTHRRRQRLRRPDDRRVGAVGGAERVVDVGVDPVDELGDERRIVALLARVEAQVLQQLDARAPARPAAPEPAPSSTSGSGAPFGRPRWLAQTTVAPLRLQPFDRRQRGADAEVVGDPTRPSIGTLKSVRTSTRLPLTVAEVLERGDAVIARRSLLRAWAASGRRTA